MLYRQLELLVKYAPYLYFGCNLIFSRSSLIAGLDCGLDYWTGLLDWITGLDCWTGSLDWTAGLTFKLKLCVSRNLHPIRYAELGHMFDA